MEQASCQVCGGQHSRPYMDRADRFGGEVFHYVQCAQCGEIYLNPRPTLEEISAYYPEHYESFDTLEKHASRLQQTLMWKNQEKILKYVQRFTPGPGALLDIGCSTGQFLRVARHHGWSVTGVELVDEAAQVARSQYQLDVRTGNLDSVSLTPQSFDLITLWDVLEHLHEPRAALAKIHTLLKPNGVLAIGYPNLDSYDRRIFQSAWIGWDAPRHLYLFSLAAFQHLFQAAGFELIAKRCLTGGKGAFFLSLDFALADTPRTAWMRAARPVISALLWPYRQWSYLVNKGPGITLIARRV